MPKRLTVRVICSECREAYGEELLLKYKEFERLKKEGKIQEMLYRIELCERCKNA